ncbi:MAG: PQQ-binding-like beta-propeller repeat protein [Acidimicrobiales bacterium]
MAAVVLVVVLAAAAATSLGGTAAPKRLRHGAAKSASTPTGAGVASATQSPAIEAGLMPWALPVPLSRMVVVAGSGPNLEIAGGLVASGASTDGVATLDTSTGQLTRQANLPAPVHDAAGAAIAGRAVAFGGGSPTTFAAVQSAPLPGTAGPPAQLSQLPAPRSDAVAVTLAGATYLVGGYNGSAPTPQVLATKDGRTFRVVASLSVPVRYPAVAASGGYLYVFGGQAVGGAGQDVRAIQRVDPARHRSAVVGHLPLALAGAAAFALGGHVYLAGGESPGPTASTPGEGTTQLDGWGSAPSQAPAAEHPVGQVWAFDPASDRVVPAGQLQVPVAHAGVAVAAGQAWLVGGESGGQVLGTVQVLRPNPAFGLAGHPGAGSPYYGYQLLVADRGNNRLLLMDPEMRVTWSYPSATSPPDPLGFYFPDDAFFVRHGTAIISNQEENETIVEIGYPSGKILWSYGHPKVPGTAPGYLHEPDDAYLLKNGQVTVADAQNCRVLVINPGGTVRSQIGTNGACVHHPPTSMGSPNGDTPLWDGNLLISEINGSWVSEYTTDGSLVWTVHLPISYPSDPQQLDAGPGHNTDRYMIADYASPGEVLQFDRQGHVLSTYRVTAGPGELDHPSLAEELPSGVYMINDDYSDRMVAIDPADGALVWQYGITSQPGTSTGMLNHPDGFDVLGPRGTSPTHPQTG